MDILTRLLLNTDGFDAKLSKSKGGVRSFESSVTSMASKAGASVLKFAGGIGLAVTAGEAFNKVLNSSQTLGDMTASNMQAAKESVDQFFYSLGAGEFNNFLNGLGDIISKAKEAHAAMDQLGNTKISHGFFTAENQAKIQESQYIAKNKFAPLQERNTAFEEWRKAIESQEEINETLKHDLIEAITTSVEAEIGTGKIKVSMDDVRMALKVDVTNPLKRNGLKTQYSSQYEDYQKQVATLQKRIGATFGDKESVKIHTDELNRQIAELGEQYRDAIIVNAMLNKYTDEELTGIAGMGQEYQNLTTSLKSISREYNETANEFNNANKAIKGFTAVASLEGYKTYTDTSTTAGNNKPKVDDVQLIAANLEAWARQEALGGTKFKQPLEQPLKIVPLPISTEEILEEALPQSEVEIKLRAKLEDYNFAKKKIAELKELMEVATTPEEKKQLSGQIDEWAKFGNVFNQDSIKQNNDYAESLGGIASIMGAISNMTNDGAGAWLTWSANLMTAVGSAIPLIEKLTAAKKGEAMANAVSSATETPVVGWLMAGAAVASVVAAFASMPKLASGGIAYGNSIVNVGEYAGASGNPEVIAPLSKLREYIQPQERNAPLNGNVRFIIKGSDLVGTFNNHNKRMSKI